MKDIDGMSAQSAQWLVRLMEGRRVPTSLTLESTGLNSTWLDDVEAKVQPEQYLKIVRNALDASGDPALGLKVGQIPNLGEFGFWGYAIISSATLGEALEVVQQFWKINGSLVRLIRSESPDFVTLEIKPAFLITEERLWIYAVEELLSTFNVGMSFLSNRDLHFKGISVSYDEPAHHRAYEELFRCPVRFGREVDTFNIPTAYRNIPTSLGNPQVAEACKRQCEMMMAKMGMQPDLITSVRETILLQPGSIPRLEEVARRLSISPRTLQRQLKSQNTSFRAILEEMLYEQSQNYLLGTDLTVEQIAYRTGFSDASAFRHAFKKWAGMSPLQFRKSTGA